MQNVTVIPAEDMRIVNVPEGAVTLTARELEALQLAARGEDAKSSARIMGVTDATVKVHRKGIMRKLNARNTTHAVVMALKAGLIK